jgi:hypothetical protein
MPTTNPEFLVIDTEGSPILREVAVVDARGELLLEAFTPDQDDAYHSSDLVWPLPDRLRSLTQNTGAAILTLTMQRSQPRSPCPLRARGVALPWRLDVVSCQVQG